MEAYQKKDLQKIWIIYFLILGLFSICEQTILFPIIFLLGKIFRSIFPTLKLLFHLWLYYPEYRGALLLDQKFGKFIDLAFMKLNPFLGKFLTLLGLTNKDTSGQAKKNE